MKKINPLYKLSAGLFLVAIIIISIKNLTNKENIATYRKESDTNNTKVFFYISGCVFLGLVARQIQKSRINNIAKNTTQSISIKKNNTSESKNKKTGDLRREVKSYDIKGLEYRNIKDSDRGFFYGYISHIAHEKDKNAIQIINSDNKLIGYLPKGKSKLVKHLYEWHNGTLPCWGNITNDYYFRGSYVSFPLGSPANEINKYVQILEIDKTNTILKNKKSISPDEVFTIFDNYLKAHEIYLTLENKLILIDSPYNLIAGFTKRLEENKDWNRLIKLENYMHIINHMPKTTKPATLRRIEIAKSELAKI
ncbi:hypothetical protein [Flavobacterium sp. NRK1]|uniref:hypothetical protein n=1 Tax=Flavobacterium sp. NRK1 TaxID=2954929 RepID=UPI0020930163|nr:hypothetical protein [Flavobacterium sp. NRK1]MCO6149094.1 hypothetical protein [Flavobacterium sp. NRK1]